MDLEKIVSSGPEGIGDMLNEILKLKDKFEQWLSERAEPNLIEFARKAVKHQSKWQDFIVFSEKRRLALRKLKKMA